MASRSSVKAFSCRCRSGLKTKQASSLHLGMSLNWVPFPLFLLLYHGPRGYYFDNHKGPTCVFFCQLLLSLSFVHTHFRKEPTQKGRHNYYTRQCYSRSEGLRPVQ